MKDATKQIKWLKAMRKLNKAKKAEKSILITMKIDPDNLSAFNMKCELHKRPYISMIKDLMREYLEK
jgi:hypothetical protein